MAGNDIVLFGDNKLAAVPAHIAAVYKPEDSNLVERDRLPTLTFTGKVFAIQADGETTKLMRVIDGDEVPLASLPIVILDYAPQRGRSYYEGAYDPDNTGGPLCWSSDSLTPDDSVAEKQSAKCATCKWSQKGSRLTDNNKPAVACAQYRLLAVVPAKRMDLPPLRMKIAVTSDYDGRSKDLQEKGEFAFSNYLEFIRVRGVPHSRAVVTKIKFDPGQAYPKILFSASRWLEEAEVTRVQEIAGEGGIERILQGMPVDPRGVGDRDGAEGEGGVDAKAAALAEAKRKEDEKKAEAKRKAEEKAAAKKAEEERKAAEKAEEERLAAEAAAKAKPDASKEKFLPGAIGDLGDDDDDAGSTLASASAKPAGAKANGKAAASAAAPKVVEAAEPEGGVPEEVADMLRSWGDD